MAKLQVMQPDSTFPVDDRAKCIVVDSILYWKCGGQVIYPAVWGCRKFNFLQCLRSALVYTAAVGARLPPVQAASGV